ncbi:LolA-related protein [[Pseudomonas] boreopolis]|uniref:LolA-related protein n=1 Tax=Xanthomonas boreopolis TaxID=86183 RepID=UPI003D465A44
MRRLFTPMLICAAAPLPAAAADGADASAIVHALARPAPSATAFVELRGSALLKQPLRVSGEYRRPDADTLVREVRAPYHETTTIRGGQATIERDGKPAQRFDLARVPELAGLQASFSALLAGDADALQREYRVQATGGTHGWTLTLQPQDAALARRVRQVALHGAGNELRCIETTPARGEVQRTLLGGAALAAPPSLDAGALRALCGSDG